ncbi:hypothetical protein ES288_A08G197200v1 [Gossypium darwinii]|uniref:Uncharacterized protein n=1 Tax=Gossypium darwinii TaxID=34276 RepID=A0A5D2FR43_GOSDA|nr:hypothetical protein ES288_A08G197200v1 [Gossypium darwinii]
MTTKSRLSNLGVEGFRETKNESKGLSSLEPSWSSSVATLLSHSTTTLERPLCHATLKPSRISHNWELRTEPLPIDLQKLATQLGNESRRTPLIEDQVPDTFEAPSVLNLVHLKVGGLQLT